VRDLVDVWKVDIMYAPISGDEDADQRVTDTIPLVVNTMGWSKGLGADLVQKIEEMVEPSHIFYFKVDNDFSYYKPAVFSSQHPDDDVTNVHVLDPAPVSVLSTSYTATDHRTLSILSYLYALFPLPPKLPSDEATCHQIMVQTWDVTLPLCAIPPYEVDIHTAFDQIILTGAGSEDVIPEELDRVLNGALVGFVQPDHKGSFKLAAGNDDNPKKAPYVQCQPPPPPSESTCIGLGLVRAVSFPTSNTDSSSSPATLHILTPVPPALLAGARVLVKGEIELPVWGMLDFREFDGADTGGVAGIEKGRVPYLQWGRVSESAIGAERRRVRRNLMRRGQA
jgi:polynucleotide 5'-hydroxyl-kinase GRC3/NOL9